MSRQPRPFYELDRKYQSRLIKQKSHRVPVNFVLSTRLKPWHELSAIRQRVLIKQGDPRVPPGAEPPPCPKYTKKKSDWDKKTTKERIELYWQNDERVPKNWEPPYERAWRTNTPGKDNATKQKKAPVEDKEYKPLVRDGSPGLMNTKGVIPEMFIGLSMPELVTALRNYLPTVEDLDQRDQEKSRSMRRQGYWAEFEEDFEFAYARAILTKEGRPNWKATCEKYNVGYRPFGQWLHRKRRLETEMSAAQKTTPLVPPATNSHT
jgi:hypothetical protein